MIPEIGTLQRHLIDSNQVLTGGWSNNGPEFTGSSPAEFVMYPFTDKPVTPKILQKDLVQIDLPVQVAFALHGKLKGGSLATMLNIYSQLVTAEVNVEIKSINIFSGDAFEQMYDKKLTNSGIEIIWFLITVTITASIYDCGDCIQFEDC